MKQFPLNDEELSDFDEIKKAIASATLQAIDESTPFTVECDASDVAVAATLNQNGRPVAFMSRSFQGSELSYPAVEKEATAIIEAVRKWSHLLMRNHFYLITDQRSVAFMLDSRKRSKIKHNKVMCWRLELASFSYSIQYRPGCENVGPDTLTRAFCASISESKLETLHRELCCPGVTRLWHFVRAKNLPYSLDEVKRCCEKCTTCAELKPQFFKPDQQTLIKAMQPMDRLNIDFKGPLPSVSKNYFLFCVVDEFSRFPFCFPCSNMNASTIITCLERIFALFGTCGYVHSDRGPSLMSQQLKDFLQQKGIAHSQTTPYHPQGNAQCERYNGILWKAIQCALKSRSLPTSKWELVMSEAVSSVRSLLCTSTNQTPHSRFFNFPRRSYHGRSLPEWLCRPGPVLLRKFVRSSKHDDLVRQVELIEANPMYAKIRYPYGRESNVSLRDLARCPSTVERQELEKEKMMFKQSVYNVDKNQLSEVNVDQKESSQDSNNHEIGQSEQMSCIPPNGERSGTELTDNVLMENTVSGPRYPTRCNRGVPPTRYGCSD